MLFPHIPAHFMTSLLDTSRLRVTEVITWSHFREFYSSTAKKQDQNGILVCVSITYSFILPIYCSLTMDLRSLSSSSSERHPSVPSACIPRVLYHSWLMMQQLLKFVWIETLPGSQETEDWKTRQANKQATQINDARLNGRGSLVPPCVVPRHGACR